jgi:tripartite-type tricarboxylate transporter receptor subunit TctC
MVCTSVAPTPQAPTQRCAANDVMNPRRFKMTAVHPKEFATAVYLPAVALLRHTDPRNAMKLCRRHFLHLAAGAAALPSVSRIARAQAYPTRPVRIIVGFAAGGGYDIVARLMGQWLSERLDQPFVIENRPGAATNIATQVVVNAPADGYTLLLVGVTNAINTTFYPKLNFNFIRDIAPVASITRQPQAMLVNPSFPAKTIPELIDYAKANPGKINMSSPGVGSISHLAGELFKMMAGVNLVHVPFSGNSPALTALLGGQVEVSVASLPSAIEFIRTGKLRGLAVTTTMRSEALPDLPALGEFVPGYEVSAWYGVGAPKGTPAEVIDKLNKEINTGIADPKLQARIADFGGTPFALSPADFGKFIADETEKWAKVIRALNIKAG